MKKSNLGIVVVAIVVVLLMLGLLVLMLLFGNSERPGSLARPQFFEPDSAETTTDPAIVTQPESEPVPIIADTINSIVETFEEPEPEIWSADISPAVHPQFAQAIENYDKFERLTDPQGEADITIGISDKNPIGTWVYAAVLPFKSTRDDVGMGELKERWLAAENRLVVTQNAFDTMQVLWGAAGAGVEILAPPDIAGWLWRVEGTMGVVEFQELTPVVKALRVDGISPLQHNLDLAKYPLAISLGVEGNRNAIGDFVAQWNQQYFTNRSEDKMTRVTMTGVTALVRATAYEMEQRGVLYPVEEVADVLRDADILHISNEVPFVADCPYPDPSDGTRFCSADKYFELLTHIGTDVVELTGNHVNDYGSAEFSRTIDFYEANGMQWFGGGRNSADAREPAKFEHNGNRIAFVGCNPVGPVYAWADENSAGSRPCDDSIFAQISTLRAEGWLPIVTQQYTEFYEYDAPGVQVSDFWRYAEAGAVGVSGSQAHHAQGFSFHNGAFVHYGLGNIFFDQMDMMGTRQTLIDHYVFYDGQLVNIEITTALIENFARPRIMEANERRQLLEVLFSVSDWP